MKQTLAVIYLMVGLGYALGMEEYHPAKNDRYLVGRVVLWPIGFGIVMARHNRAIQDLYRVGKSIAGAAE